MSLLSLYIPERWDGPACTLPWRWLHDDGTRGESGDGRALPGAREVRLVLPTPAVVSAEVALPRRGRWQEALPFALEDQMLSDVDQLHVAAGAETATGRTPVAAVARDWLAAVLSQAAALGVTPDTAYAEAMLAPTRDQEWLLLLGPDEAILVQPGQPTVVLDQRDDETPPAMLRVLLDRQGAEQRPQALRVRLRPGLREPAGMTYWSESLGLPVLRGAPWEQDMPDVAEHAINLLQGRFAPVRRQRGLRPALQGPVLLLLAASLAAWLLGTLIQTMLWAREAGALQARSEAALRRAFPETRTILDVPLQMQRGLDALRARTGGGAGTLAAPLARVAAAAAGLPARVQHLAWRDGSLRVEWRCTDEASASALRQRLADPRYAMDLVAGSTDATLVAARVKEPRP